MSIARSIGARKLFSSFYRVALERVRSKIKKNNNIRIAFGVFDGSPARVS